MTITVRPGPTQLDNQPASATYSLPSGTVAGDVILLGLTGYIPNGRSVTAVGGTGAAYATAINTNNGSGTAYYAQLWWHTVTSGETGVTISATGGGGGSVGYAALSGCDPTSPIVSVSALSTTDGGSHPTSSTTAFNAPSVTTTAANQAVVGYYDALHGGQASGGTTYVSSNWGGTHGWASNSFNSLDLELKAIAASGTVATPSINFTENSQYVGIPWMWTLLIQPLNNPPNTPGTPSPASGDVARSQTFSVGVSDPDGNNCYALFRYSTDVNMGTYSDVGGTTVASGGTSTATINFPSANTTYYVWAYANDGKVYSGRSTAATVFTNRTPSVPTLTGPSGTLTNAKPTLTATVSDPDSDNVFAYYQVATDSGFTNVVFSGAGSTVTSGAGSTLVTSGLAASTLYYYRAYTQDAYGRQSGYCAAGTFTTSAAITQSFVYTGGAQTFTVPTGITQINFDARGAQGGNGGAGRRITGVLNVSAGEIFDLYVGQTGAYGGSPATANPATYPDGGASGVNGGNGNGGSGGGSTRIYRRNTTANIVIAGGGGGGGSGAAVGGEGGAGGAAAGPGGVGGTGATGLQDSPNSNPPLVTASSGSGGAGGGNNSGGAAGSTNNVPSNYGWPSAGTATQGGSGGGTYSGSYYNGSGGGGGGGYGCGGGGSGGNGSFANGYQGGSGGGGGGSFVGTVASSVDQGANAAAGTAIFSYPNYSTTTNTAPNAPTLTAPAASAIVAAGPTTISWAFSDPDAGSSQGGYALRVVDPTGATSYWNATNQAFQAGVVINNTSTQSALLPAGALYGGSWTYTVSTTDQFGLQGPYATAVAFTVAGGFSMMI